MRKRFMTLSLCLGLALLAAPVFAADRTAPDVLVEARTELPVIQAGEARYRDLPKGVVLEEGAFGVEALKTIVYDKKENVFTINGTAQYKPPVDRRDFARVFKALQKDDRLGVTLVQGDARTYGKITSSTNIAEDMIATDRLIGGVIFGLEHLLEGIKLPGGYKPQTTDKRDTPIVLFTTFKGFRFEKKENAYRCIDCTMDVQMVPIKQGARSALGGHVADPAAVVSFTPAPTDKANFDHLRSMQADYFKMRQFSGTLKWGEVAAFARTVRDSGLDQEAFLKQID